MRAAAACYTRASDGTHLLLLRRSIDGALEAFDCSEPSLEAHCVASALSRGTGSLFAPADNPAEDVEAYLASKIRAGRGIRELSAEGLRLCLVPVRHVALDPTRLALEWVPASDLLLTSGNNALSPSLTALLGTSNSQHVLIQMAKGVQGGKAAKAEAEANADADEEAEYIPAIDPTVPRKLDTDIFLGELSSVLNEALVGFLGITHVLIVAPDVDDDMPASHARIGGGSGCDAGVGGDGPVAAAASATVSPASFSVAFAVALAKRMGLTLAILRGGVAAVRDGQAASLLAEGCDFISLGRARGGVLIAGPIAQDAEANPAATAAAATTANFFSSSPPPPSAAASASAAPVTGSPTAPRPPRVGPLWITCAYLASVTPNLSIGKALVRCRALFPGARLNASLAVEAEAFSKDRLARGLAAAVRAGATAAAASMESDGGVGVVGVGVGGMAGLAGAEDEDGAEATPYDPAAGGAAAEGLRRLNRKLRLIALREAAELAEEEPIHRAAALLSLGGGDHLRALWPLEEALEALEEGGMGGVGSLPPGLAEARAAEEASRNAKARALAEAKALAEADAAEAAASALAEAEAKQAAKLQAKEAYWEMKRAKAEAREARRNSHASGDQVSGGGQMG